MTQGVVVWEFLADIPGLYTPYSDKVSNYIEAEYVKDPSSTVQLEKADPLLKPYEIDLAALKQIVVQNRSSRDVRRQIYDEKSTIGNGIVWEWITDAGWVAYDYEALNAIEDAFAKNQEEFDLSQLSFNLPNIVMMQKGYQRNKSSNFVRPIQRRAATYTSTVKKQPSTRIRAQDARSIPQLPHNVSAMPSSVPGSNRVRRGDKQVKQVHSKQPKSPHVSEFCILITEEPKDQDCTICLITLKDDDDSVADQVVQLKKCKHMFHESCMEAYCKHGQQNGCIQCPVCKKIHGIKLGNQPDGTMNVSKDMRQAVAGYEGCGMITVSYNFPPGIQGPGHPNPGQPYQLYGFPRTGYFPANEKGMKVLKLLELAWKRKLIFTVGTSTTTGMNEAVIWNEIHHKTSPRDNRSGHGYPDPKYLDNVIEELKQHGVTDETDDDDDDDGN